MLPNIKKIATFYIWSPLNTQVHGILESSRQSLNPADHSKNKKSKFYQGYIWKLNAKASGRKARFQSYIIYIVSYSLESYLKLKALSI